MSIEFRVGSKEFKYKKLNGEREQHQGSDVNYLLAVWHLWSCRAPIRRSGLRELRRRGLRNSSKFS